MTQGLENALYRTLNGLRQNVRPNIHVNDVPHDYLLYIIVDTSDKTRIECPLSHVQSIIKTLDRQPELNKIIIPLQSKDYYYRDEAKSIDSAFKIIFESIEGYTIRRAIINDLTFYGLPGMLFDTDFNPLMSITVELNYRNGEDISFSNYTVNIPPQVYFKDDKISKGIIKKLMPYYMAKPFTSCFNTRARDESFSPIVTFKPITNIKNNYNVSINEGINPKDILSNSIQTLRNSLNYVF